MDWLERSRTRRRVRVRRSIQAGNEGFTLIELLVCVAILAVLAVPLFSGFRLSAFMNNKAHYTQLATELAQKEMELVKSLSVEEYEDRVRVSVDVDGNPAGGVSPDPLPAPLTPADKITFTETKIDIGAAGGESYDLTVVLDPAPYNKDAAAAGESSGDLNRYGIVGVESIDGMKFPVISDEINRFEAPDGSGRAAVLSNLLGMVKDKDLASYGASAGDRLLNILSRTKKTVDVTITGEYDPHDAAKQYIRVVCDLIYEVDGTDLKLVYNVFSGKYKLKAATGTGGAFLDWEEGGNVFVFARGWMEKDGVNEYLPMENTVNIRNLYTGAEPLCIYLVRGYYGTAPNRWGVNFDQVNLIGSSGASAYVPSMPLPSSSPAELTGFNAAFGGFNGDFYTNIKGKRDGADRLDRKMHEALTGDPRYNDFEQTVGPEKARLRCYEATVTLTEHDTGELAASVKSTKLVEE